VQSLDYFYPIKDRERRSETSDRLSVRMAEALPAADGDRGVDALKTELLRLKT
jgi:hypothetical protein